MPERVPHYVSLFGALLAGFWTATNAPATHLFEQTMRALDITGQVLSPLALLSDSAATLLVMATVYLGVSALFARLGFVASEG